MTKVEYGNGDVTTYTYNSLTLRLTRLYTVDKNGAALQDLNYTYDSVGNILSIDDKVNTADQTFQYDELNRLTQATNPNPGTYGLPAGQAGTKTYVYDAIGNIVQKDGKTYFYPASGGAGGPHAVTSLSDGTTFSYDANGNMVTKVEAAVTTAYTYDAENRLTKVVKNGSVIGQYEYDGDGGRTKKTATVSGTTTTTIYVGSLFETSGSRTTKFIFLGDQRVAAVTNSPTLGSTTLYYHADHLGGANVLTDGTGFKKELIEYEPFGQESRHEKYGSSEEVAWYYFTGKKTDDESGLIYFGARYYSPALGRFITADSLVQKPGDPQTLNRYTYCRNNPVNLVDPTGHWFWAAIVAIVKAVAAASAAHPFIAGAVIGGVTGGVNAAVQGSNIFQGIAIGAGIGWATGGINSFIPGGGTFSKNLLLNMGYHSVRGAAIGSVLGGGINSAFGGEFGDGARMGAITGGIGGAIGGFTSSEQFGNWVKNDKFMTNSRYAAYKSMRLGFEEMTTGQTGTYGKAGIVSAGNRGNYMHTAIFSDTPGDGLQGWGKYPSIEGSNMEWVFGRSVPGEIVNEFSTGFLQRTDTSVLGFDISPVQAQAFNQYRSGNAGIFALKTDCADWALGGLREMGISHPDNLRTFTYTDPRKVQNWIDSYR